jgi:hypothetical protein
MRVMFCRHQRERKLDVFFSTKKAQDACREVVCTECQFFLACASKILLVQLFAGATFASKTAIFKISQQNF